MIKTVLVLLSLVVFLGCAKNSRPTTAQPSPTPTPVNLTPIPVPTVIVGKEYPAKGKVVLINKKEGWIEIDHEEIKDMMPPMVMEWPVEPRSLMNQVKVGDQVDFIVVETGKGQIITKLKKVE
jgi:Cu/Ag efflux protein CusF